MKVTAFVLLLANLHFSTAWFMSQTSETGVPSDLGDYNACYIGSRGTVDGKVVTDDVALAVCQYPGSRCYLYKYKLDVNGTMVDLEYGNCIPKGYESNVTCEALSKGSAPWGTVSNCTVDFCDGRGCNNFTVAPTAECKPTPDYDVQLLPSCTMGEVLYGWKYCVKDLYSGYPYEDRNTCAKEMSNAMQCLGGHLMTCMAGPCPTVLDSMPGARTFFMMVKDEIYKLKDASAEEIIDKHLDMWAMDNATRAYLKNMIEEIGCPIPGKVPDAIQMAYEWAKTVSDDDLNKSFNDWLDSMNVTAEMRAFFPCKQDYHIAVMKVGIDAMMQWFSATDRRGICDSFSTFMIRSVSAFNNMCDPNKIYAILEKLVPVKAARNTITKALGVWGYFWNDLKLPNCPADTQQQLGCEKYYLDDTACGVRKAWLCDYAYWKINFLTQWLNEFQQYQIGNVLVDVSLDAPKCDDFDQSMLCKNLGQEKCFYSFNDCPVCYCMDHEYRDLSGLSMVWRKDYVGWRHVFRIYKEAFNKSTCSSKMPMKPME